MSEREKEREREREDACTIRKSSNESSGLGNSIVAGWCFHDEHAEHAYACMNAYMHVFVASFF